MIIDGVLENVSERTKAFFQCFVDMDMDEEFSIAGGVGAQPGEKPVALIVIGLDGNQFPFTTEQARAIAGIAEAVMRLHPDAPGLKGFSDLILGLRYGADEADRLFEEQQ